MRSIVVFAWFVLAAMWICVVGADAELRQVQEADGEWSRHIDEFAWTGPLFIKGLRSLKQVRRLSLLRSETVTTVPNPFIDGETNEFRTLTFEGLKISGLVRSNGDFGLTSLVITSAKWQVRDGLGVGTRAARIAGILGPPVEKTEALLRYRGDVEQINFYIANDVITKLEFFYYFD